MDAFDCYADNSKDWDREVSIRMVKQDNIYLCEECPYSSKNKTEEELKDYLVGSSCFFEEILISSIKYKLVFSADYTWKYIVTTALGTEVKQGTWEVLSSNKISKYSLLPM